MTNKKESKKLTEKIRQSLIEARALAEAGELADYRWDRSHRIHTAIYDAEKYAEKQGRDISLQVNEITDLALARAFTESIRSAKKNAEEGDSEMVEKWGWAINKYAEEINRKFPEKTYADITKKCYEVCKNKLEKVIIEIQKKV